MCHFYLLPRCYSLYFNLRHISVYRTTPPVSNSRSTLLKLCDQTGITAGPLVCLFSPRRPIKEERRGERGTERGGGGSRSGGQSLHAQQSVDVSPSSWEQRESCSGKILQSHRSSKRRGWNRGMKRVGGVLLGGGIAYVTHLLEELEGEVWNFTPACSVAIEVKPVLEQIPQQLFQSASVGNNASS